MGIDTAPILLASGLSHGSLRNPLARVDARVEHLFWDAAEAAAGDPAIGLRVGMEQARHPPRFVDVYIAFHSGTLRRMYENVQLFVKLADDRARLVLEEAGTLATVRISRDGGYPRARGYLDQMFAHGVGAYRQQVPGFRLSGLLLERPVPKDLAPYLEAFEVRPQFGATTNEMSFDRALLDVPFASDPQLLEILKEHAAELLRKVPSVDPLLYSVQRALHDGLESGQVGLAHIARVTGTSTRTLRRRLAELGTSLREELDDLRCELGSRELRDGDASVEQVGRRVGFVSTKGFELAFRRWTGLSPTAYRKQQREKAEYRVRPDGAQAERGRAFR